MKEHYLYNLKNNQVKKNNEHFNGEYRPLQNGTTSLALRTKEHRSVK